MTDHTKPDITVTTDSGVPPRRGPAHERLEMFVGAWDAAGRTFMPSDLTGRETYEWLPGEFFLVYRFDRTYGENAHRGLGVFRVDPADQSYSATFYDNLGYARDYAVTVDGRRWTLTGPWERATIEFSEDGQRLDEHWDRSDDGENWLPLCDFSATRVNPS